MSRALIEYTPETETFEVDALEALEPEGETSGIFGETEEMELGAELLEITSEPELDLYIGSLIKRTGQHAGALLSPDARQALGGFLKAAARHSLPTLGRRARSAPLGSQAAAVGARIFGLELEGLSPEDSEFEVARTFVRFAGDAIGNAASIRTAAPPQSIARAAVVKAARHHAPGLLITSKLDPSVHPLTVVKESTMHNIDRTQLEYAPEMESFEGESFELDEQEWLGEEEWLGEAGMLGESEELELASELLSVSNEAELDQFLGNLIKRASKAVGSVVRSPVGQALGGVLKSAAKKALPLAGGAIGGYFGGPLGAKIGSGLASAAGSALGLEAEALSGEELEFEGAKQFVRFATRAVQKAAAAPAGANPTAIAKAATTAAARQLVPGLLGKAGLRGQSGRWVRRGTRIVLYGA